MGKALDVVKEFYDLMGKNRFEEANRFLAEDVVIHETPDLPFGGDYHGLEGNARLIGAMTSVFDLAIENIDFLDAGDTVIARISANFTVKESGTPLALDIVEIIQVRDGKMVDLNIYHKTPSALAAHWPGDPASG